MCACVCVSKRALGDGMGEEAVGVYPWEGMREHLCETKQTKDYEQEAGDWVSMLASNQISFYQFALTPRSFC